MSASIMPKETAYVVSGANNVTIENVEVINSSPPSGNQDETSDNINNILVSKLPESDRAQRHA